MKNTEKPNIFLENPKLGCLATVVGWLLTLITVIVITAGTLAWKWDAEKWTVLSIYGAAGFLFGLSWLLSWGAKNGKSWVVWIIVAFFN